MNRMPRISLAGLRLDMMFTLSLIIAISAFAFIYLVGPSVGLVGGIILALGFNFVMWLISPALIKRMYALREVSRAEAPWLHSKLEEIARRSGLRRVPKLYATPIRIPNAFAFGNPFTGYGVAITDGLIYLLDEEELEAVIAHEVGHIRHGDMHVMMLATALPAVFLHIGRWLIWSGMWGDYERRREGGGAALLGFIFTIIGWLLYLLALRLSRLREFYADAHAALVVPRGASKLQRALVKIAKNTDPRLGAELATAKALMIHDPTRPAVEEEDIQRIMNREVGPFERFLSLLSTHPRIEERLRKLEELKRYTG